MRDVALLNCYFHGCTCLGQGGTSGFTDNGTVVFCSQNNVGLIQRLEFTKFLSENQTGKTLIRLLLQKQTDLGLPFCLGFCVMQLLLEMLEHLPFCIYLICLSGNKLLN